MNPILLSHWLRATEQAGIAAVGATLGPAVHVDELRRAATGRSLEDGLVGVHRWLQAHYRPGATIWRWDCCAPVGLKEAMRAETVPREAPSLDLEPDDERLLHVLDELERHGDAEVCVLVRPWVAARFEAAVPVELRVFASDEGVAVSCYHRRRRLPASYIAVAEQAAEATARLARVVPREHFSADFILAADGQLLFLESGLGWDGGRLVDRCCFDAAPRPGDIALGPSV